MTCAKSLYMINYSLAPVPDKEIVKIYYHNFNMKRTGEYWTGLGSIILGYKAVANWFFFSCWRLARFSTNFREKKKRHFHKMLHFSPSTDPPFLAFCLYYFLIFDWLTGQNWLVMNPPFKESTDHGLRMVYCKISPRNVLTSTLPVGPIVFWLCCGRILLLPQM